MFWKKFDLKKVKGEGVIIKGDPYTHKSRWWNYILLATVFWRKIWVLEIRTNSPSFRLVCVQEGEGVCRIYRKSIYDKIIRVGVRREDCCFFAIDDDGGEIPVVVLERNLDRNTEAYSDLLIV